MCYEFSGWFKKARMPEQARKEVKTEKSATREAPVAAPQPVEPERQVTEREKVPA